MGYFLFFIAMGTNTQGISCNLIMFKVDDNYSKTLNFFEWYNTFYSRTPCRFTSEFYFAFYFFFGIVYLMCLPFMAALRDKIYNSQKYFILEFFAVWVLLSALLGYYTVLYSYDLNLYRIIIGTLIPIFPVLMLHGLIYIIGIVFKKLEWIR
jgi:hypothetical protein